MDKYSLFSRELILLADKATHIWLCYIRQIFPSTSEIHILKFRYISGKPHVKNHSLWFHLQKIEKDVLSNSEDLQMENEDHH